MLTLRTANAFKSLLEVSKVSIEIERPLNPRRKQPLLVDNFRKCIHAVNYICQSALSKAKSLYKKSVEPPLSPPPGASVATSIWISIGCFMTLLLLFGLNIFVKDVSNDEYIIVLGPLGALLTLQFALTAAPAAQPRNSVYGFMVSILMSLFCKFLLFEILHIPQWLAAAIGVSLAIGCMSKAGVVHPPGGAAALIFAMSKHSIDKDLVLAGILICADLVVIFMATLINNMSDTRQYPMYWSFFSKSRKVE
jgi:CBS-domain-containing membrane protein